MDKRVFNFILFLTVFFLVFSYISNSKKGDYIKLHNNTNMDLKNLSFVSAMLKDSIEIQIIKSSDFKEIKLNLKDKSSVGDLELVYFNNKGEQIKQILIQNFKTSNPLQKRFFIESIDQNGVLKIKENRFGILNM